jgi:zinc/manganese transport system substrate-binding protein
MQKSIRIIAVVAVVISAVAAVGYTAYVSHAPTAQSSCAGVRTMARGDAPSPLGPRGPPASPSDVGPRAGGLGASPVLATPATPYSSTGGIIQVVAAENFWGSLVSQLGGNATSVLSIVSDPNADPHEYSANTSDAIAFSNAQLVVVNGVGYDNWALQLIAADNNPSQVVLNVGSLNGVVLGGGIVSGNPHQWYNPVYVNQTVAAMYSDLVQISPEHRADFQQNYATLNLSLASLYGEANSIRTHFAGAVVAATEDIFVYLANYTHLDLISPPEFMQAVAEGNDPPAQSVVTFQCELESGAVKVLVYNQQTVTPITDSMKVIAAEHNVTIVGVTETIQPPGVSFQVWMNAEYLQLYNALNSL